MKCSLVCAFALLLVSCPVMAHNGKCVTGDCTEGRGVMMYADGSQYVGQWQNGRPNGQGVYTMPDGSEYVGEFKNGFPDGKGRLTAADGSESYIGDFRHGEYDGIGVQITRLGVRSGRWKNGEYVGR